MTADWCCPAQGFFGDDCANEAEHLQYGVPVVKEASSFEYDFFQLPEISPAMLTHSVEVRVRASFSSNGYGEWAAARPELLLLKVQFLLSPSTTTCALPFIALLKQKERAAFLTSQACLMCSDVVISFPMLILLILCLYHGCPAIILMISSCLLRFK